MKRLLSTVITVIVTLAVLEALEAVSTQLAFVVAALALGYCAGRLHEMGMAA